MHHLYRVLSPLSPLSYITRLAQENILEKYILGKQMAQDPSQGTESLPVGHQFKYSLLPEGYLPLTVDGGS